MKKLIVLCCSFLLTAGMAFAQQDNGKMEYFGEKISPDGAITYSQMLAKLENEEEVNVKVRGTVDAVCQMKGCWMTILSTEEGHDDIFVKFKDYAFFVPKDISGREVIMEGLVYREITSVDELRHYAEDEGKSKAEIMAITEPKEELKFMASGVILLP